MRLTKKQMDKKYWFTGKRYGWGWTPATKEGWVILVVFVILEVLLSLLDFNLFIFGTIILLPILIYICYKKGERPKWRWGN